MHSYEINKHGKIVFPSNCFPDLDFSTFESLEQLDAVVRRDFDSKAPTGTDILEQIKTGAYQSKFELMRDMALNLFWANRFKITMYDVRPTRWADVPRNRDDVFIPIQTPWEDSETKVSAVLSAYPNLPAQWDGAVQPRIEAIAAAHGDQVCTNEDLIRNSAYNWSPMSADEISAKTGIEQRRYTSGSLEDLSLRAARSALAHAQVGPAQIGAVIVCTCTSSRLIPSVATWISGALGIQQTHCSFDLVAACAGLSYGLAEATRVLQLVRRPVLLVCAEKFSDKIGNVRPSRMIFGDGAAAIVLGVAPEGSPPDIEYMQTYASGPTSQVNSILWPNPAYGNNITVFGPEVKALAGRYLVQMLDDIRALPDPDGVAESLLASIELIVPHQANKTMVVDLATGAGLSPDQLYFNIERVGNASSASIPLAIHDAVRDQVITRPTRVFAPGFGAGAVAGYAVLRIDPAVIAPDDQAAAAGESAAVDESLTLLAGADMALAFG
jgi:3-oxoacyl-(acyl-carrier-protein) synthase III